MTKRIYVFGYPGDHGGARTECWHTLRLWRRHGVPITCIPTWRADPTWRAKLEGIGVDTQECHPKNIQLPNGSTTIAFCEHPYLRVAKQLANCRRIWAPCMNYLCDAELKLLREEGPLEQYVFQSRFQAGLLGGQLAQYGVRSDQCIRIPGTFCWENWRFSPQVHRNGDPFVVGRVSRSDPRKFSRQTWEIYAAVPNVRARVLGWAPALASRCGKPPPFAECLGRGAEPVERFMGSLHALVHAGGEAVENWPRYVLEAMASGVPVVTDNSGGLPEMIEDGRTGFLCGSAEEMIRKTKLLAEREDVRQRIASEARTALENELADPEEIWHRWQRVFDGSGDAGITRGLEEVIARQQ